MNDRFKFRIWDKFCETWLTDFAINQDGEINKFFNSKEALKRRFVLMQCTGLKDKNGKLIYEGDILKDDSNIIASVYWEEEEVKFIFIEKSLYVIDISKSICDEIEVIGNIYTDAHLLEETKND